MTPVTVKDWLTPQLKAREEIRIEFAKTEVTQRAVAAHLGMTESRFSNYLSCREQWPADFEQRVREAIAELAK